jgi:acetyl-CoA carboxylase carboxyltransferase component
MPEQSQMGAVQLPSVGWLLSLIEDGKIFDVDGSSVDLRGGVSAEAIAQDDGVIAGTAQVEGNEVAVFAQEPSYKGGSMGLKHTKRLERLVSIATERGLPIIGLYDSGGVRVLEGGNSLEEASALLGQLMKAKDVVPVVNAVMGTTTGAATYSAYMGDVLVVTRGLSRMFVWGPGVVKAETGAEVGMEELGGADVQMANGTASLVAESEKESLELVKRVVSYFATRHTNPTMPKASVDTEGPVGIIEGTFDAGSFLEFRSRFANNVTTGLARLEGRTVGIVASNKKTLRGFMDNDSCKKVSKFVSMCNSLAVPLITFLDSPGFYPAAEQERSGLISMSGEAVKEYASERCPKVTVVSGDAYGGVFVGFASKALGARKVFAYPKARISVMGLPAFLEIFQKKKLEALKGDERAKEYKRISQEFLKQMDPSIGVRLGYIDAIIDPSETRARLVSAFWAADRL